MSWPYPSQAAGWGKAGKGKGLGHPNQFPSVVYSTQAVNTIHGTATDALCHSQVQEIPDKGKLDI